MDELEDEFTRNSMNKLKEINNDTNIAPLNFRFLRVPLSSAHPQTNILFLLNANCHF